MLCGALSEHWVVRKSEGLVLMRKVVLRCDIEIVLILLGRHEETGGVRSVGASDFSNVH